MLRQGLGPSKAGPGRNKARPWDSKARLGRSKAGPRQGKAGSGHSEAEPGGGKAGLGRGKVGTSRGKAGPGRSKAEPGPGKAAHLVNNRSQKAGAKVYLDRTGVSESLFFQKYAKHGLGGVKQSRGAANQCISMKKLQKSLQDWMGGSVFGLRRRGRIAFCEKFGGARLGCVKEGVGRNKKPTFPRKKWKNGRGECVFGLTGVSG